jgi:DNA helicase-2/ATP-dependent DNA helicase PcrA
MNYTREQIDVITAPLEDDAVIHAAAGTAKTSVLAWRVAWLLKQGVTPKEVMAVTFSVRAADELRDRIMRAAEENLHRPVLGLADMTIGTFHSIAFKLLMTIPEYRRYEIASEAERRLLVRSRFNRIGLGSVPRVVAHTRESIHTHPYLTPDPHDLDLFLHIVDAVRESRVTDEVLPGELRAAMRAYSDELTRASLFDYGSVLTTLLAVLYDDRAPEHLALQRQLSENLRHVLIDEVQDCSPLLMDICVRLRGLGAHVIAVGDQRQCIYSWRYADANRFAQLHEEFSGARAYRLTNNFRSSEAIVTVANTFTQQFLGCAGAVEEMRPASAVRRHEVGDVVALRFATQEEQYRWGARRLKALLNTPWLDNPTSSPRGLGPRDMMVLCRTRREMSAVMAALRDEGFDSIQVRGEDCLLVPAEAEALATVLDHLAGGRASWNRESRRVQLTEVTEADVRTAVSSANFGVSDLATERAIQWLRDLPLNNDLWEQSTCLIALLEMWLSDVLGVKYTGEGGSAEEVRWYAIRRILDACGVYQRFGFARALKSKVRGFARWLRIEASSVMRDNEAGGGDGIREAADAVQLMTCHSCKGLEAPVVWLPNLVAGLFPLRPRAADSWQLIPRDQCSPTQARCFEETYSDQLRGEANLFYVSLTRSSRHLLCTYAPHPKAKRSRPSPFLVFLERQPGVKRDLEVQSQLGVSDAGRLPLCPRVANKTLTLTYSMIFSYTVCPRLFYLRYVLRCLPPLNDRIGFGTGLHSAAAEVHQRVQTGELLSPVCLDQITHRHLHLPLAAETAKAHLRQAANRALTTYVDDYNVQTDPHRIQSVEREVRLGLGRINLVGRIDLVTKDAAGRIVLDELKAEKTARDHEMLVARGYALAYAATAGQMPERVGVRSLAADGAEKYRFTEMDEANIRDTQTRLTEAGSRIIGREFSPLPMQGAATCSCCDFRVICSGRVAQQLELMGDDGAPVGDNAAFSKKKSICERK